MKFWVAQSIKIKIFLIVSLFAPVIRVGRIPSFVAEGWYSVAEDAS